MVEGLQGMSTMLGEYCWETNDINGGWNSKNPMAESWGVWVWGEVLRTLHPKKLPM